MEKKKKHSKKALFASASTEVEEKGKKCQKQGPPGHNSEEKKVEKKCRKGALFSSDSALEEKRKRKCQNQAPLNPPQHQDSVDQKGTSDCMCVRQGGGSADPMYDRGYLLPLGLGLVRKYFHPGQSILARMTCPASEFSGACPKYAFLSPSLQIPKLGRVGLQMTHPSQALGPLPRNLPIP